MSDEAAAPAKPKEKSALEKEMEALLGQAGEVGVGAKKAQGEAAKVRRKSKDLEESLDKMAENSDMWKDLGGGGDASQSRIWSGTAQIDPERHGTRRPRPPAAASHVTPALAHANGVWRPRSPRAQHERVHRAPQGGEAGEARATTRTTRCWRPSRRLTSTATATSSRPSLRRRSEPWYRSATEQATEHAAPPAGPAALQSRCPRADARRRPPPPVCVVSAQDPKISGAKCTEMMQFADTDGDGKVVFEEYKKILMYKPSAAP